VAYLLSVPLDSDSGGVLVFEADQSQMIEGLVLASPTPGELADRAKVTFEEALKHLRPSLEKFVEFLKSLSPDETTVEFGLSAGGETGFIIAKGTVGANFVVRMSWSSEKKHDELGTP
jgi:Trypsin-co-occurring domain 1